MVVTLRRRPISVLVCLFAIVVAARPAAAQYQLKAQPYVTGLSAPVGFVQDPGNPAVQYVVQQGGRIRVIQNGVLLGTDFLNVSGRIVSGGEQGLLGLAFPPDYATSGRFYINYTESTHGDTVVARYKRSTGNPLVADAASEKRMIWQSGFDHIVQPFANHNGGHLAFGPDGYLYIGMGDGGSGGDPDNHAQNFGDLLGKMLRIDVSVLDTDLRGYAVPPDNPFLTRIGALPEIWDLGLRNPWQFSFDSVNGALVIADVGQSAWEEIDYEPAGQGGKNYGWSFREGAHVGFPTGKTAAPIPFTDPIFEYSHSVGQSISGGLVYRGTNLGAPFKGRYFFADYVAAKVWSIALTLDGAGNATASDFRDHTADLGGTSTLGNISAFGSDASGEVYVVGYSKGTIFRVSSAAPLLRIDTPPSGSTFNQLFYLAGWAIDRRATMDSGIDTIHFYAYPNPGSGAPPIFLGYLNADGYNNRSDVAAAFGSQFVHSGFAMPVAGLERGTYLFAAFARSTTTGQFDTVATTTVTVGFSSLGTASFDSGPCCGSTRVQPFTMAGWVIDRGAMWAPPSYGTGVQSAWVQIVDTATQATAFLRGQYGMARPDVGGIYGSRFTNSGYSFEIRDLKPGSYSYRLFFWDTLTNTWMTDPVISSTFTVAAGPMVAIDTPSPGVTIAQPFSISGWALDLRATSGTGVDAIHVYAYPAAGGPPVFVGFGSATPRPDIASIFGAQFTNSGYNTTVSSLSPGTYTFVVWVHSSVTSSWAINRTITLTVQ